MTKHTIDLSSLDKADVDMPSDEKTKGKKGLDPEDRDAANRAYAIYMAKHKESVLAVREFQKKFPNKKVPDEMKVTQTSVADSVVWTQGNLSQYLTGAVPIREKALQKLCQALGCDPWDIRPETLSDTNLLKQNKQLAARANSAEERSKELAEQLNGILSTLATIEGSNEVVDKILKDNSNTRVAA